LEEAMDAVEGGISSSKKAVGAITYFLPHCLITSMAKQNLGNLSQ